MKRGAIFGRRGHRAREVVAVGLVDRDHVGQLDHALLQALQLVARTRQHQHQEEIRHVGDRGFRLSGADRFDQHDVETGRFADQHGFARLGGDAAERSTAGRGANEGVGIVGQPRHAGLVGEDRAAGARRGGIDRQHRNLVAAPGQERAERIDGGRLADARHARDADTNGLSGPWQQCLHQIPRGGLVIAAPALDQRDGARDRGAIAGQNSMRRAWRDRRFARGCAKP